MSLRTHGRYDYSPIIDRPLWDWPDGRRLAVYIAINVETFPFGEGLAPDLNPRQPALPAAALMNTAV